MLKPLRQYIIIVMDGKRLIYYDIHNAFWYMRVCLPHMTIMGLSVDCL